MRGLGSHVQFDEVNWRTLFKLTPYLLRYKKRLYFSLALLVAAKIASIGLPFVLKHLVDALDQEPVDALSMPIGFLLAYGAIRLASVLIAELRDTVFGRVTEHAMHDIALRVFRHLHSLDMDFHLNRKTGGLARDIERGTTGISFLLRFMVFNIVPTLLEIILVIGILSARYSPWFGLIVFVAIVSYVAWSIYATEIRTKHVRQMNQADSATNNRAIDSLLNYETVKYFGNEEYEARLYDDNLEQWEQARRNNRLSIFALNGGQASIISVFISVAMALAAYKIVDGSMTLGDFVLINAFMLQIFMPLNFLGFVYREMKGSLANIENLFNLFEQKPSVVDKEHTLRFDGQFNAIQLQHLSFHYHPQRLILRNINIDIPAHQKTAIVGSSGSGKSSLAKLLFRFYDPSQGRIAIDGVDLREFSMASLRASIAVVPQDAVLFNTTLLENVRYGRVTASDEEVRESMNAAQLEGFVQQLPEGWNTVVGERGLKLSGGEKQRVAIARAILKNPSIMIFDEATSSLDGHSEKLILDAINTISRKKTTVVIAHRLATIADANTIIVLEQGCVVEQGTHQQLLSRGGRYYELWKVQEREPSAVDGEKL